MVPQNCVVHVQVHEYDPGTRSWPHNMCSYLVPPTYRTSCTSWPYFVPVPIAMYPRKIHGWDSGFSAYVPSPSAVGTYLHSSKVDLARVYRMVWAHGTWHLRSTAYEKGALGTGDHLGMSRERTCTHRGSDVEGCREPIVDGKVTERVPESGERQWSAYNSS